MYDFVLIFGSKVSFFTLCFRLLHLIIPWFSLGFSWFREGVFQFTLAFRWFSFPSRWLLTGNFYLLYHSLFFNKIILKLRDTMLYLKYHIKFTYSALLESYQRIIFAEPYKHFWFIKYRLRLSSYPVLIDKLLWFSCLWHNLTIWF